MPPTISSRQAAKAAGMQFGRRGSVRSRFAWLASDGSRRAAVKGVAGIAALTGLVAALVAGPALAVAPHSDVAVPSAATSAESAVLAGNVPAPAAQAFGLTGYRATAKPVSQASAADILAGRAAPLGASRSAPRIKASGGCCLTSNATRVLIEISWAFPQIKTIGGVRADSLPDHPSGHALDIMIPDPFSSSGIALGNSVVATVQAHAREWNVKYLIYRQRIWFPNSGWKMMSDRGGATANHMDHVHVTVN